MNAKTMRESANDIQLTNLDPYLQEGARLYGLKAHGYVFGLASEFCDEFESDPPNDARPNGMRTIDTWARNGAYSDVMCRYQDAWELHDPLKADMYGFGFAMSGSEDMGLGLDIIENTNQAVTAATFAASVAVHRAVALWMLSLDSISDEDD